MRRTLPHPARVTTGLLVPALLLGVGLRAHAATRPTPPVARVTIQGYAFHPKTLVVAPGTTVRWTNTDSDIHTVVSDTTAFTASHDLPTGKSFAHTFSKTGTFRYHCGQHAFMMGTVVVQSPTRARP